MTNLATRRQVVDMFPSQVTPSPAEPQAGLALEAEAGLRHLRGQGAAGARGGGGQTLSKQGSVRSCQDHQHEL